jgi:hypothetical protein
MFKIIHQLTNEVTGASFNPNHPLTLALVYFKSSIFLFHKDRHEILTSPEIICFHDKIEKIKNNFKHFCLSETVLSNTISGSIIMICGVLFEFDSKNQAYKLVKQDYDALDLICIVNTLFSLMERINVRGYVSLSSLTDNFISDISLHLYQNGYESKVLGNSEVPFTYWYNFLFINLYYLVVKELRKHNFHNTCKKPNLYLKSLNIKGVDDIDSELEVLYELDSLKNRLFARLDQYIKIQIQNRGITIIENSYTAFDCEFENLNFLKNENKLVSVQTAVQRRTILKVPAFEPFDIGYVNPLTSEISDTFSSKVDVKQPYKNTFTKDFNTTPSRLRKGRKELNELLILNNSIKIGIKTIRLYLFNSIDSFLASLIEYLKSLKGVEGFDDFDYYYDSKRNQFIFFFPLTLPEYKIAFPNGNFNFVDLLEMSKEESDENKFAHTLEVLEYKKSQSQSSKLGTFVEKKDKTPIISTSISTVETVESETGVNEIGDKNSISTTSVSTDFSVDSVSCVSDRFNSYLSFTNDMLFKFFRGGLLDGGGQLESCFGYAWNVKVCHYFVFLVNA